MAHGAGGCWAGGGRGALGAGVALILADKLDRKERRAVGWTLFLVGMATTIPLVLMVFGNKPGKHLPAD